MSAVRVVPKVTATALPAEPAGPPPEVEAAILAALQRAEALAATGRELHYAIDAAGELHVQVRDLAGAVLREVGIAEARSIVGGLAGA